MTMLQTQYLQVQMLNSAVTTIWGTLLRRFHLEISRSYREEEPYDPIVEVLAFLAGDQ